MVEKITLSQYLIQGLLLSFLCVLFIKVLILPAVLKAAVLCIDGVGQLTQVSQLPCKSIRLIGVFHCLRAELHQFSNFINCIS